MRRRRSVLHSEGGHRHRRYKRKIRNMIFESILLIIFVFAATKFIKDDSEKPKVTRISAQEQMQIINNEMGINKEQQENNMSELEVLTTIDNIKILKIALNYQEENNETIISLDIGDSEVEITEQKVLLEILNKKQKQLTTTHVQIPYLDKNRQTRINIVLTGDYRDAKSIKIHEEQ